MPSPSTICQELRVWTRNCTNEKDKPVDVRDTLKQLCSHGRSDKLYPNIVVILRVLLTIPATRTIVERANFALKFVNNVYRRKLSEDRLNSLILIYVHKNIKLEYNDITDMYARRNPDVDAVYQPIRQQ